jgi:hypothetical protein
MNPLLQVCGLLRLQNGKQRRENQTLDIIIVNGRDQHGNSLATPSDDNWSFRLGLFNVLIDER